MHRSLHAEREYTDGQWPSVAAAAADRVADGAVIETIRRERDDELARAQLYHRETVMRLQRDHAASEAAFRSIVEHLEHQIRVAEHEGSARATEARALSDATRRDMTLEINRMTAAHRAELDALAREHARAIEAARAEAKMETERHDRERRAMFDRVAVATEQLEAQRRGTAGVGNSFSLALLFHHHSCARNAAIGQALGRGS